MNWVITTTESRARIVHEIEERGGQFDQEIHVYAKSGEQRTVSTSANIVNINGQAYTIATAFDITERILAEQRLRQSEERFATMFRQIPIPVALASYPDGKITDVNDAFCALFGVTREQGDRPFLECDRYY